jgi:PAS domain S-box-containing protein
MPIIQSLAQAKDTYSRSDMPTDRDSIALSEEARSLLTEMASVQTIPEYFPDLVCVCDPGATLIYANPSFSQTPGYAPQELTGSRLTELVHQEDRAKLMAAMEKLLRNDAAHVPEAFGYRAKHRDGSWRHISGQGCNLLPDRMVGAVLLTGRDATAEQQQLQRLGPEKKKLS